MIEFFMRERIEQENEQINSAKVVIKDSLFSKPIKNVFSFSLSHPIRSRKKSTKGKLQTNEVIFTGFFTSFPFRKKHFEYQLFHHWWKKVFKVNKSAPGIYFINILDWELMRSWIDFFTLTIFPNYCTLIFFKTL